MTSRDSTPRAWAYGRASTDHQRISPERQRDAAAEYFTFRQTSGRLPGVEWGSWLCDNATSGSIPWFERPQGELLWLQLQPGDHIILVEKDRAFRSCLDACENINRLLERDITLHVLDCPFDLSTPEGRCFLQVMASFAELERHKISDRTRAALQWKIQQGLPANAAVPVGWSKVGKGKDSRFVPCPSDRRWALHIIKRHDEDGATFEQLYFEMIKHGPRHTAGRYKGDPWHRDRIRRAYYAAKDGFPLPNGHRQACFISVEHGFQ